MRNDGNIGAWSDEQHAAIGKLSAKDIGFTVAPDWYDRFLESLRSNPSGESIRAWLHKCHAKLALFIVLIVSTPIEERLIELTEERGRKFKTAVRAGARKDQSVRAGAKEVLGRADRAFDTRRRGLADYCMGALIVREYVRFKTSHEPSARELAALLKAGLTASGRLSSVDYDLLRRNMKNFEKRYVDRVGALPTGEKCVEIIEASVPRATA